MKSIVYKTKMLGVVTLYMPSAKQAIDNIKRYLPDIETLIIWDNSPLEANIKMQVINALKEWSDKIVWIGNGKNLCISPAINYAWHFAQEQQYDFLLIMDQDSKWDNFADYRQHIEHFWTEGNKWVFTPYFVGTEIPSDGSVKFLRLFINSGTVIPIEILTTVGGADESMPLDALDHDLAIRIQKAGYKIACITSSTLHHTIGTPTISTTLHLKTSNYSSWRTYSIARCHAINFRKHSDWLTFNEKKRIIKEYYLRRFILIILNEEDKWNRIKMLIKGTIDGLKYPLE